MGTTLNLEDNQIGVEGAIAPGEALKVNSTVTTLDLRSNQIGPWGAIALGEALKVNSTVTTLDLSYNQIGNYKEFLDIIEKEIWKNVRILTEVESFPVYKYCCVSLLLYDKHEKQEEEE